MKELLLLGVIAGLFVLGVAIALNSGGDGQRADGRLRVLVGNFSAMLLRVAGYGAGLLVLQKVIGSPSVLGW